MLFQIFSRKSDINGNPYRLLLVYSGSGEIIQAYEARSSIPNIAGALRKSYAELPTFSLTPKEYNETKKYLQVPLVRED